MSRNKPSDGSRTDDEPIKKAAKELRSDDGDNNDLFCGGTESVLSFLTFGLCILSSNGHEARKKTKLHEDATGVSVTLFPQNTADTDSMVETVYSEVGSHIQSSVVESVYSEVGSHLNTPPRSCVS